MVSVNSSTMLGLSSWIVLLHIIILRIHMLTYLDITKLDRGTVKPVWLAIQVTDLHFQLFSHILISCLTPWQWLQNIQKYCANGDQWSLHLLCPNSSPVFTTSTTIYLHHYYQNPRAAVQMSSALCKTQENFWDFISIEFHSVSICYDMFRWGLLRLQLKWTERQSTARYPATSKRSMVCTHARPTRAMQASIVSNAQSSMVPSKWKWSRDREGLCLSHPDRGRPSAAQTNRHHQHPSTGWHPCSLPESNLFTSVT